MFMVGQRVILLEDDQVYVVDSVNQDTNTYNIHLESNPAVTRQGVPEGGMKIAD